jgi:predicted RNase H-like nuclease (RuvC/YqgF family)
VSVKKYNTYLINNGFLEEETTSKTDSAGLPIIQKNFNLNGLQQAALWVKAVTEQITMNTADIEDMKDEISSLRKELENLKREQSLYRNKTKEPLIFEM